MIKTKRYLFTLITVVTAIFCGCSSALSDSAVIIESGNAIAISETADVNYTYTIQDVVNLQNFLVNRPTEENLKDKPYDLNKDGIWNVFDLCIMKREIIKPVSDKLYLTINDTKFSATLENNSSVDTMKEKLSDGDITIDAREYGGFEKVGSLGFSLPKNDTQYSTDFGDIMLYQGNQITLFYEPNSWSYTKIGHVDNMTQEELKNILGKGDVKITLSLK